MLIRIPPASRRLMMKMSGLASLDKWAAFALSVPGLVVSASSVSDSMACLRLIGARQEMIMFIGKGHVGDECWCRRRGRLDD
jgi:hypothetical protein